MNKCFKAVFIFSIYILLFSCSSSYDSKNDYKIKYDDKSVSVYNDKSGRIKFDIEGETFIVKGGGGGRKGSLVNDGVLVRVNETPIKNEIYTFRLQQKDYKLIIEYEVTYKQDELIELEGLVGKSFGNMAFDKYSNIFIEGNPDYAGFFKKEKVSRFDIRPALGLKTYFGLLNYFGEVKSHYNKSNETKDKFIKRKAGENFKIIFKVLYENKTIQLLSQPNGYNSTFTFVNHADYQNIQRQNAIFYGSSNPNNPSYGHKGIVSRGLKGTWTVFAKSSGLDTNRNEGLDNPVYMNECLKLKSAGIEIIPHTISYDPDFRDDFEKYLHLFDTFAPRNWVDHFLRTNNPSSGLHSQGNDTNSKNYIMDLLENIDYVWSYQDTYKYGDSENKINQLFDERFAFPSYLIYERNNISRPINGNVWQYKNTWTSLRYLIKEDIKPKEFIDKLVEKCGVWTEHSYFAMRSRENIHWQKEGKDIVISDKLDSYFEEIENRIIKKEIWNPTMTEWLDFNVLLLNLNIEHKGTYIELNNRNDKVISGCSFNK